MRVPLLLCVTTLAASTALAQQAGQTSPSSSSSKSQTDPTSQTGTSTQPGISSQPGQPSSSTLSATGRGAGHAGQQQQFRSTKIMGAQVKTTSGEDAGRIEDVLLNPASGRIDFAILSSEGKLVPVPWQLLSISGGASAQGGTPSASSTTRGTSTSTDPSRTSPSSTPSPGSTPSATAPSSSGVYASAAASAGQPSFTLNTDKAKLQSAPSFDRSRWPEMSASWSQQVYSHFGVQPQTGAGGTGAGSYKGSQGSTTDQGATGTSSDKSSGKSSSDPDKSSSDIKK